MKEEHFIKSLYRIRCLLVQGINLLILYMAQAIRYIVYLLLFIQVYSCSTQKTGYVGISDYIILNDEKNSIPSFEDREWEYRMEDLICRLFEEDFSETTIKSWNLLSTRIDGCVAESYNEYFFDFFNRHSKEVLIWIYNHRYDRDENLSRIILDMLEINSGNDTKDDEHYYYPTYSIVARSIETISDFKIRQFLYNRFFSDFNKDLNQH